MALIGKNGGISGFYEGFPDISNPWGDVSSAPFASGTGAGDTYVQPGFGIGWTTFALPAGQSLVSLTSSKSKSTAGIPAPVLPAPVVPAPRMTPAPTLRPITAPPAANQPFYSPESPLTPKIEIAAAAARTVSSAIARLLAPVGLLYPSAIAPEPFVYSQKPKPPSSRDEPAIIPETIPEVWKSYIEYLPPIEEPPTWQPDLSPPLQYPEQSPSPYSPEVIPPPSKAKPILPQLPQLPGYSPQIPFLPSWPGLDIPGVSPWPSITPITPLQPSKKSPFPPQNDSDLGRVDLPGQSPAGNPEIAPTPQEDQCKKSSTEPRKKCFVFVTRQKRIPATDTIHNWREIPCQ